MGRMKRLAGLFCAASALIGAAAAQEQGCGEALNLENADIRTVVDEIALRTGKKFVLDPRVSGQVTIKSGPNGGLCADEAWELFQAALRVTGFTATPLNHNSYKIIPVQEGSRAAGPVGEGDPLARLDRAPVSLAHAAGDLEALGPDLGIDAGKRGIGGTVRRPALARKPDGQRDFGLPLARAAIRGSIRAFRPMPARKTNFRCPSKSPWSTA